MARQIETQLDKEGLRSTLQMDEDGESLPPTPALPLHVGSRRGFLEKDLMHGLIDAHAERFKIQGDIERSLAVSKVAD